LALCKVDVKSKFTA